MLPRLTPAEFQVLINSKPYSVILLDANWNGTGRQLLSRFEDAIERFGEQIAFCEIDTDEAQELALKLNLTNVPAIAFYRGGQLVKLHIGASQDIVRQAELLVAGAEIPYLSAIVNPPVHPTSVVDYRETWYSKFWRWIFTP